MTAPTSGTTPRRRTTFDCTECGMLQEGPAFHPYWHCVLYKSGVDPRHLDPPDPRIEQAEAALAEALALLATWMVYHPHDMPHPGSGACSRCEVLGDTISFLAAHGAEEEK